MGVTLTIAVNLHEEARRAASEAMAREAFDSRPGPLEPVAAMQQLQESRALAKRLRRPLALAAGRLPAPALESHYNEAPWDLQTQVGWQSFSHHHSALMEY